MAVYAAVVRAAKHAADEIVAWDVESFSNLALVFTDFELDVHCWHSPRGLGPKVWPHHICQRGGWFHHARRTGLAVYPLSPRGYGDGLDPFGGRGDHNRPPLAPLSHFVS